LRWLKAEFPLPKRARVAFLLILTVLALARDASGGM
jgi:hypothetical protein